MEDKDKVKRLLRKEAQEKKRDSIATAKIAKAYEKSPEKGALANKKFGYNYSGAIKAGITPDETGHWDSRDPETGEIFKGRRHPTISKTKQAERKFGYKIKNIKGTLYSFKKNEKK
jgi:hypothetical protein